MVLLIDYGMGNIGSIRRALEECGADVFGRQGFGCRAASRVEGVLACARPLPSSAHRY